MSSEPAVPFNNDERVEDSPYVAPGTDRELRKEEHGPVEEISAGRTDRLLEREYPRSRPLGEIPREPAPRLHDAAETVGAAVGSAVNKARDLPRQFSEMKERFTIVRGRVREDTATTASELRENAKQKFEQAQTRAEHYAHEFPLQFILGVGAFGFVIGMFLRAWRSNRRG